MNSLINSSVTLLGVIASAFAVVAGLYALHDWLISRPFKRRLSIFSDPTVLTETLLKLEGRTVNFDTLLDFSVWNELSHRIAATHEYQTILRRPASDINNTPLPLYALQEGGRLDSFARLIVSVKDGKRLKFSHGGTGVIYVLLKGRFEIEVRHYAGPSIEFTLREVS